MKMQMLQFQDQIDREGDGLRQSKIRSVLNKYMVKDRTYHIREIHVRGDLFDVYFCNAKERETEVRNVLKNAKERGEIISPREDYYVRVKQIV